jgi:hypothetical protein
VSGSAGDPKSAKATILIGRTTQLILSAAVRESQSEASGPITDSAVYYPDFYPTAWQTVLASWAL